MKNGLSPCRSGNIWGGFAILLLAGLAIGLSAPTLAQVRAPKAAPVQNPDRTFTPGADYDTIVKRGWILIGVYKDFAPYSWVEDGRFFGVDVELGRMIARALAVKPRFVALGAAETVDDDLRNHVWKGPLVGRKVVNVMMHVPHDARLARRNEQVVLTGRYMVEAIAIAYRRDAYPDTKPVPAYFRFDPVGVENDTLSDFYLSRIGNGMLLPKMQRFRTVAEAMAAMKAGKVKAVVGPRSQLMHAIDRTFAIHEPPLPGLAVGKWTLGVAIRHNYRQLGYAVDDAISTAIADGQLKAAFEKFGLKLVLPAR